MGTIKTILRWIFIYIPTGAFSLFCAFSIVWYVYTLLKEKIQNKSPKKKKSHVTAKDIGKGCTGCLIHPSIIIVILVILGYVLLGSSKMDYSTKKAIESFIYSPVGIVTIIVVGIPLAIGVYIAISKLTMWISGKMVKLYDKIDKNNDEDNKD